jgi:hypothetical protein
MGLSSVFVIIPPPSGLAHRANDGLPAGVDVHVLDGNFLLPLPSIALQRLGLGCESSQKFHSEISVAVLLGYHVRALQTAQRACRSEMRRNHLDCQHCLDFVVRPDPMNRREYSIDVFLCWRMTGGAITGRTDEAIEQNTHNRCLRRSEHQR